MKIDPTKIWWLILILLPMISVGAGILSETFSGQGYMEAWHDSEKVTDRTVAQGRYDYGAELYPSGLSSGLNISNGTASYSFQSGDYSIRLKKFSGEIVAEADSNGTIIDLSGSGKMSAISYPTRPYASSVRPFPIGGLKGEGELFLHAATEFENIPLDMWNGTEWANTPVNQTPVIDINQFHLTATTTGASETVSIARLTTYYDTTIDWGDGTAPETLVANVTTARTHVYATAGTYPITVNHAHLITQLQVDNAKLGGLDTAELKYSRLTYFWVTLATGCTIDSADMVDWRPTTWRLFSMPAGTYSISSAHMVDWRPTAWWLYSMPAGTYSISSAHMVDWRPTTWQLYSMPAAGSSYTFAASCMRAWTALATLTMNDLALDAATIDLVLADLYAGRMGYTAAAPTATMGGTNADPTGVYQAMVPPTTGMETKYELINDSASQGFKKWAITT